MPAPGSVISMPMWVLFAAPPQCQPRISHGSVWYTVPSACANACTQTDWPPGWYWSKYRASAAALGCGAPMLCSIRPRGTSAAPA